MAVLELVSVDNEKVVIKINAKDPLTVAMNPEFSSNMAYITVTRGEKHIMTIIREDGTTWSFHWGGGSSTLISDSVAAMRNKVVDFIRENGIVFGLTNKPSEATIYYNNNYKSWQLTLRHGSESDYIWYKDAHNEYDMMAYAKKFLNPICWQKRVAQTGIDVWRAVL